jgi:hypothetical protein
MGRYRDPVVNQPIDTRRRGQLYIGSAALAWSIAGAMQRGLKIDTATQASGRAFFAFLALSVVVTYEARRYRCDSGHRAHGCGDGNLSGRSLGQFHNRA